MTARHTWCWGVISPNVQTQLLLSIPLVLFLVLNSLSLFSSSSRWVCVFAAGGGGGGGGGGAARSAFARSTLHEWSGLIFSASARCCLQWNEPVSYGTTQVGHWQSLSCGVGRKWQKYSVVGVGLCWVSGKACCGFGWGYEHEQVAARIVWHDLLVMHPRLYWYRCEGANSKM